MEDAAHAAPVAAVYTTCGSVAIVALIDFRDDGQGCLLTLYSPLDDSTLQAPAARRSYSNFPAPAK